MKTTALFEGAALAGLAIAAATFLAIRPAMDLTPHDTPNASVTDKRGPVNGIDVSHYQGRIDWQRVAKSGVRFAYIKSTEGNTYLDPRFHANLQGARKAGMVTGAYHFFIPGDEPIRQAEHFLKTAWTGPGSLPPALDLEKVPHHARNHEVGKAALQWLRHVEKKTGCKPVVYSNRSYWQTYLVDDLAEYPFWLAEYARHAHLPTAVSDWTLWQHSQKGQVPGIRGHVDLDRIAGGAAGLRALTCREAVR